jgi:hypothetical protein
MFGFSIKREEGLTATVFYGGSDSKGKGSKKAEYLSGFFFR